MNAASTAQPCCDGTKSLCCQFQASMNRLQCFFLLALRVYFGLGFFMTGKGKLMNLERTTAFFTSLNLPMPHLNAMLAGGTEMICGLLLLVGLFSRVAALPLIFTMSVAYATAHADTLAVFFTDPEKFLTAPPFLFLLTSLIVLLFGPGRISLDYFCKVRCCAKKGSCITTDTSSSCCSV